MSDWKTGILTIWSFGKKIAKSTNTNPRTAAKLNIDLLENLEPKTPPVNLPTNIKNQYVPTTVPAVVALICKSPVI